MKHLKFADTFFEMFTVFCFNSLLKLETLRLSLKLPVGHRGYVGARKFRSLANEKIVAETLSWSL